MREFREARKRGKAPCGLGKRGGMELYRMTGRGGGGGGSP